MEPGFKAGTCSPLTLSVIKDGVLESDETLQLSATDTDSRAIPSSTNGGAALVTITDDDSACESSVYKGLPRNIAALQSSS